MRIQGGGRGGARPPPPPLSSTEYTFIYNFWIKYAPNCREMHLKFQKFLGGMPSDPPGAHTCDERTASLSPTPHAHPLSKILDPRLKAGLCSRREDGLSCRHGVNSPLTHSKAGLSCRLGVKPPLTHSVTGRWFPPGTPVSSTIKLISSSSLFHRLDMTLAVAEALNPQ